MHKISLIGLLIALVPSLCMGESMRVNRLIQEKQRKMAELEKCMGSTKGLKIAGISTLGLTAVGVVGNVAEAKKINEYDDKIESTEKSIEKTQKQIDETRTDLAEQKAKVETERKAAEAKQRAKTSCVQSGGKWNEEISGCVCPIASGYHLNYTTGMCEKDANAATTAISTTTMTTGNGTITATGTTTNDTGATNGNGSNGGTM
ncbi:MAG: hypothetical protein IKP35_01595 [Alphaproteobacteria bacterium]|nr:hypothetical protein [Alphaproteobacteria bacterium]